MAIADAIKRLIYQFTSTGADQVAGDMTKITAAQTTTSTSALNLEKSFDALERRYITSVRAAQDYANVQAKVAAAVAQNPALQERANEVLAVAAQRYGQAGQAQSAYAAAISGMQSQMIAMAGGFGLVGTALAAFGPAGLAAAVGLKLVADAFKYVSDEANRMGEKAIAVRQLSEVTGLTAREISGLRHAAAEFGVSGDTITTAVERLTLQMNDARQATGPLYEGIREVDAGLAQSLTNAEGSAEGIDILARAYRDAGNEAQKAAIARAAFGRGGAGAGPVLGAIANAGGIDALSNSTKVLTDATDKQNAAWAQMRAETVELEKQAANILASIFTEAGLKAAHDAAQAMRDAALATKEFIEARKGLTPFQQGLELGGGFDPGAPLAAIAARQRMTQGQGENLAADPKAIQSWGQLSDALHGIKSPAEEAEASLKKLQDAAQAAANQEKERIGFLGAAATADEKRIATLLELSAAFLKNKLSAEDYARAVDAANHAAEALTAVHEAAIQTLHARTAAEREAAAAATVKASDASGDAAVKAQQAVTMEIEKQKQAHQDAMAAGANQLAIASAVGGAERRAAEEAAKFNQLIREGRTQEQALAEAAQGTAIAKAQANTAAKEQLFTLQNHLQVSQAITGIQKIYAQGQETFNRLIHDGVDAEIAMKVAMQEIDNALAEVNAKVERQIISLKQANELTAARQSGGENQIAGLAAEGTVAAQQAYNNALAEGATQENAMALGLQVRLKYNLQINEAVEKERQARMAAAAAEQEQLNKDMDRALEASNQAAREATQSTASALGGALVNVVTQLEAAGDHFFEFLKQGIAISSQQMAIFLKQAEDRLKQIQDQKAADDKAQQAQQEAHQKAQQAQQEAQQKAQQAQQEAASKQKSITDQIRSLIEAANLKAAEAQGGDAAAQYKAQLAYTKAIEDGATIEQATQIATLTLASALVSNTSAVQANTNALSPYYATDPRLSHIGFRPDSGVLDYDPFKLAASGAPGPAALPAGSSSTSSGLPVIFSPPIVPAAPAAPAPVAAQVNAGPYSTQVWPQGELASTDPLGQYWNRFSLSVVAPGWVSAGNYVDVSGQPIPLSRVQTGPIYLADGGMLAPGGLAYVGEHGPNPGFIRAGSEPIMISPDDPRQNGKQQDERPIQIVQNFNAPVDRSVAEEMKITAFQATRASLRSLNMAR